jgi:hypothetical protein
VTIELAIDTTTQLLSGPSGSGKTTELYRLRGELLRAGFHAEIFDVGAYVNESSPIDVTKFLLALALLAHDVLGAPGAENGPGFVGPAAPPAGPPQDLRRRPRPVRQRVAGGPGDRGAGRVGQGRAAARTEEQRTGGGGAAQQATCSQRRAMNTGRQAARSLHRDVEAVWERLRAEFALGAGFWLVFLFSIPAPDVAELVARTSDQARPQVKHVATVT